MSFYIILTIILVWIDCYDCSLYQYLGNGVADLLNSGIWAQSTEQVSKTRSITRGLFYPDDMFVTNWVPSIVTTRTSEQRHNERRTSDCTEIEECGEPHLPARSSGSRPGPITDGSSGGRMSTHRLLQDPVRATSTADIQRMLQKSSTRAPQPPRPKHRPSKRPQQQVTAKTVSRSSSATTRKPKQVSKTFWAPLTPTVKTRTEAQQARNHKKFPKPKTKEQLASQQHRLAKLSTPTSQPAAANRPLSKMTPKVSMEVDLLATEGRTSDEPVLDTVQERLSQAADPDTYSEDAWL
ncbi:uncharacterized protein LOC112600199 [Melanaphis sacchari]|uniref:uncharacterized protein LOC112600199 n=1 Tax=Melanaphis sacchari TaxID=742174 RepID=UPI000DC13EC1|nr:uncharacterized protein LOC112600199 [Melanaphis sacchari]